MRAARAVHPSDHVAANLPTIVAGHAESPAEQSPEVPTRPDRFGSGSRQDFINGAGTLRSEYRQAVVQYAEDAGADGQKAEQISGTRSEGFQHRLESIYGPNLESFRTMASIGDDLPKSPPPTPEEIGHRLADAMAASNFSALSKEQRTDLMGAVSGVMIGARITFGDKGAVQGANERMVDAFQNGLNKHGLAQVQPVIWGDTGEPGLTANAPKMSPEQRHHYLPAD